MKGSGMARNCKLATTLAALLLIGACTGQDEGYPALLPAEVLFAPPAVPAHARDAASSADMAERELLGGRENLRQRARQATEQQGDMSDLDRRVQALHARAGRLSATSLRDDDGAADAR